MLTNESLKRDVLLYRMRHWVSWINWPPVEEDACDTQRCLLLSTSSRPLTGHDHRWARHSLLRSTLLQMTDQGFEGFLTVSLIHEILFEDC